jgi:hypothetical protein
MKRLGIKIFLARFIDHRGESIVAALASPPTIPISLPARDGREPLLLQ